MFRTEKRRNPTTGATYPWIVKTTAMVNHFYIYALDADFVNLAEVLSDSVIHRTVGVIVPLADTGAGRVRQGQTVQRPGNRQENGRITRPIPRKMREEIPRGRFTDARSAQLSSLLRR